MEFSNMKLIIVVHELCMKCLHTFNKKFSLFNCILFVYFSEAAKLCKDDEYQCTSGECIKFFQRCDMVVDCPNGEDETFCRMFLTFI